MRLALYDMLHCGAREIRVTTGEDVYRNHALFFLAAGFKVIDWQVNRYRRGVSELLLKFEVDPALWYVQGSASHTNQYGSKSESGGLPLTQPNLVPGSSLSPWVPYVKVVAGA